MKGWEEIREVDDLVLDSDRIRIKQIEEESGIRCPDLRKLGNFFFYCGNLVPDGTELRFNPLNKIYRARQGNSELQLFCMSENYRNCFYYKKP